MCLDLLVEPIVLPCCGLAACRPCISRSLRVKPDCPHCRAVVAVPIERLRVSAALVTALRILAATPPRPVLPLDAMARCAALLKETTDSFTAATNDHAALQASTFAVTRALKAMKERAALMEARAVEAEGRAAAAKRIIEVSHLEMSAATLALKTKNADLEARLAQCIARETLRERADKLAERASLAAAFTAAHHEAPPALPMASEAALPSLTSSLVASAVLPAAGAGTAASPLTSGIVAWAQSRAGVQMRPLQHQLPPLCKMFKAYNSCPEGRSCPYSHDIDHREAAMTALKAARAPPPSQQQTFARPIPPPTPPRARVTPQWSGYQFYNSREVGSIWYYDSANGNTGYESETDLKAPGLIYIPREVLVGIQVVRVAMPENAFGLDDFETWVSFSAHVHLRKIST